MKLVDFILLAVILGVAALIVWQLRRRKKKDGDGCASCESCEGCPMAGACTEKDKPEKK